MLEPQPAQSILPTTAGPAPRLCHGPHTSPWHYRPAMHKVNSPAPHSFLPSPLLPVQVRRGVKLACSLTSCSPLTNHITAPSFPAPSPCHAFIPLHAPCACVAANALPRLSLRTQRPRECASQKQVSLQSFCALTRHQPCIVALIHTTPPIEAVSAWLVIYLYRGEVDCPLIGPHHSPHPPTQFV